MIYEKNDLNDTFTSGWNKIFQPGIQFNCKRTDCLENTSVISAYVIHLFLLWSASYHEHPEIYAFTLNMNLSII